jgi:hypothetical protein
LIVRVCLRGMANFSGKMHAEDPIQEMWCGFNSSTVVFN